MEEITTLNEIKKCPPSIVVLICLVVVSLPHEEEPSFDGQNIYHFGFACLKLIDVFGNINQMMLTYSLVTFVLI